MPRARDRSLAVMLGLLLSVRVGSMSERLLVCSDVLCVSVSVLSVRECRETHGSRGGRSACRTCFAEEPGLPTGAGAGTGPVPVPVLRGDSVQICAPAEGVPRCPHSHTMSVRGQSRSARAFR